MKKILVTHANFKGAVELVYGDPGIGENAWPPLLVVDFRGAELNDVQKTSLLKYLPVRYGDGFAQSWGNSGLQFVYEDVEWDFNRDFYNHYGKKVNPDRCLAKWKLLTRPEKALACARVHAYLRYLSRMGTGKADPENYLGKKLFNNDYDNL